MTRAPLFLFLPSLTLAFVGSPAPAAAEARPRHTKVWLVAETDAVQPGRVLNLAIRLQMEPGWHTYWRNPGDAGLPTRVKWTLPSGIEAGEIRWPYPERFTQGPVGSYGYTREVLLLSQMSVSPSLAGPEARIAAHVDWLECQEVCLPGKTDLSLVLAVRGVARPGPDAAAFAEARGRLPVADPAWRFAAAEAGESIALSVVPPKGTAVSEAFFCPVTPRLLDYGKPQRLERTPSGFRLDLPRDPNGAPAERLAGVLVVGSGEKSRALEVEAGLGATAGAPRPRR